MPGHEQSPLQGAKTPKDAEMCQVQLCPGMSEWKHPAAEEGTPEGPVQLTTRGMARSFAYRVAAKTSSPGEETWMTSGRWVMR